MNFVENPKFELIDEFLLESDTSMKHYTNTSSNNSSYFNDFELKIESLEENQEYEVNELNFQAISEKLQAFEAIPDHINFQKEY